MSELWRAALKRAREEAPFLARSLDKQPDLEALLAAGNGGSALEWAKAAGQGGDDLGIALRRERLALATALAIGDLAGEFDLTLVVRELSDFADRALDAAIKGAIAGRVEGAGSEGMFALGLGKQGAHELNYSSDIDPILLFEPEMLACRDRDDPSEAAQRYARQIVKTLSENTAEGYVFRVDLRLRPASEISPLAVPRPSALAHYQSSALAWERAAFIRARSVSGDIAMGEEFLDAIQPFVWHSTLDFGAVEEVRKLTRRIRSNYDGPPEPGPGFNLKHGRGGIREIEFFAQTHQLIHGGRDESLRVRGTRDALDALANAGQIEREQADILGRSYDRLRTIEHRLQMVHDRQTHSLPEGAALDSVARLDGLADGRALVAELEELTDAVARCYDTLIDEEEPQSRMEVEAQPLSDHLAQLGFPDPAGLSERISGWRDGRYQSLRSEAALDAFDAMLPAMLAALADAVDLDRALLRWESVLANAASAVNLFRLLEARPELLAQLMAVLTLSPTLADELGQRPALLDCMIDGRALELPGTTQELVENMAVDTPHYEDQLDKIRVDTGETRFALGVQLIEGAHDPLDIASALSRAAEAAMQVAFEAALAEFAQRHGVIEGSELIVLGLGRLGGGMLTHASDLDIIYLFTGEFDAQSNGERPLSATHYYNRLAQRLTAALSVPTAQGALYEVDTRLRPQGNQGPLAASVESFAKYQRESAWTWEHMALTRARVLIGSDAARQELDAIIKQVLARKRDPDELRTAVLKMRNDMAKHKPAGGLLDIKLQRGGLVDLEFLIHFLQLRDGIAFDPNLETALEDLTGAGLVPESLAADYHLMGRILVSTRLLAPKLKAPPPAAAKALARACGENNFDCLLQRLEQARHNVAKCWSAAFGEQLEF